ncbi:MAG: hypothetical protein L0Y71_10515 [Gemmataceae bacterium]|nr:hypothetical protein [Gemmataceae bacterium]
MNRQSNSKNGRARTGSRASTKRASKKAKVVTVAERFEFLIGQAQGLPADFSRNLDHYLYGAPKRS